MNGARALLSLIGFAGVLLSSSPAGAQVGAPDAPRVSGQGKAATLIGPNTAQLYWYDRDKPGTSECYGTCAAAWPPFGPKAGTKASGKFSIVTRRDGTKQWAYDGHPLYFWKNDVSGGGTSYPIPNHWHVAHVANL